MTTVSEKQVELLHEHYRDSCGAMQSQRASRDRYFYLVIAVLAVALFDVATPQGFANVIGDVLKSQLNLVTAPDLAYVRSILWFLLLGLTVRYSQVTLNLERQYDYIHDLEAVLQQHVHAVFRREGGAILRSILASLFGRTSFTPSSSRCCCAWWRWSGLIARSQHGHGLGLLGSIWPSPFCFWFLLDSTLKLSTENASTVA